jgi:amino acid adenylation domain-containing protein
MSSEGTVPDRTAALAPLQAGMLFQAMLDQGGGHVEGYDVEQIVVACRAPVDTERFKAAWRLMVKRHAVLRTSFQWDGQARPIQRVHDDATLPLVEHDWDGVDDGERRRRLDALLAHDRAQPFDLRSAPLARLHVCRRGPARVDVIWSFHHILLDGRSFTKILVELFQALEALDAGREPALPPAPRPFTDFASWVSERKTDESRAFFRRLLAGKASPTPLPGAEAAPGNDHGAGEALGVVDEATTAALVKLAADTGTTLATVVQGMWALVLARWTGDDDVVFGNTRACRKSALDGNTDDMVGMFINTLPVRARMDDGRTLRELLVDLRRQGVEMRDHEHTPLVDVQGCSDIPRGAALFETVLMFENAALNARLRAADPSWAARDVELHERPSPPLTLTAFGGKSLELRLLWEKRRFRTVTAERLVAHLVATAARFARGPDEKLGHLDTMPDDERKKVLFDWNDTAKPFRDDILIHTLFEEQVAKRPDEQAVLFEGTWRTFREVDEHANRIANALLARGIGAGDMVAFLVERSHDLVATMLGVAKSGAAYVPIDPGYPPDRARFMIDDAGAKVLLASAELAQALGPVATGVLLVDSEEIRSAPSSRPTLKRTPSPNDVCYAIYTSGSTGKPKGVILTHKAVVNTLLWVSTTWKIGPGDRLLFVTSPSFDLSVYDVFGALGAGAAVEVASAHTLREPTLLVKKLVEPGITIWDSAPPALSRLVPFFPKKAPSSTLRLAMMSGDWIPVRLPDELRSIFPRVEPKSLGGATEAAIWSNFHDIDRVDATWRSIPYGRPIDNARYYILDRRLQPVPPGIAGDLYIGGVCLAQGYLRREELTAERFLADPHVTGERIYKTGDLARFWEDGTMEFLGRADFQVKVRGFRVELGEIEAALRKGHGVREAVCITRPDASGEKAIFGYVVPEEGATLDPAMLRASLVGVLPDFMVPAAIVVVERMPVTANGKLDRNALPDPSTVGRGRQTAPPRTPLEEKLVAMWQDVLRRSPIGIHDDFFQLGGHSLLAVMLVTRIKSELGLDVRLSEILARPTIADLATALGDVKASDDSKSGSPLVVFNATGTRPPLLIVSGVGGQVFIFRELAQKLGADQPVVAFTAIGADGEDFPRQSVEEIAGAYEEELARRGLVAGGPIVVGGYSFGALVAFELARRLRKKGRRVNGIVAFDAFAPGYPERMPRWKRALAHVEELWRRDNAGRAAYLLERVDNVRRRVLFKVGLGARLAPEVEGADKEREERMKQIWALLMQAQQAYRPSHVDDAPMLLFNAEHPLRWPATRMDDPMKGWRRYVRGPIDVITVKGTHLELFRSDNIDVMAKSITALVDRTRGTR